MTKSLHLADLTLFNTLAEYTRHISTEVGADLIPKLRSLYCRVP